MALNINFIPLQKMHFPLLLKWLETPHVKRWWDADVQWTPELIEKKYSQYVQEFKHLTLKDRVIKKPMHAFIMCMNGEEVGYIQYYNACDFPREQGYTIEGLPDNLASIDVFIGESDWIGKGVGPLLIDEFLQKHVFKEFQGMCVDPATDNLGAIRAYEKAGFEKVNESKGITWMVRYRDVH